MMPQPPMAAPQQPMAQAPRPQAMGDGTTQKIDEEALDIPAFLRRQAN